MTEKHEDIEASDDERRAAEALARAMDGGIDPTPDTAGAMVEKIRASRAPTGLDPAVRALLVSRAVTSARTARRRRWARPAIVAFAAAAGVLLAVAGGLASRDTAASRLYGGPSDAVFGEPFPDDEPASARLDRLTSARTRDYFAATLAGGER